MAKELTVKISDLPLVDEINDGAIMPLVNSGITYKTSAAEFRGYVLAGIQSGLQGPQGLQGNQGSYGPQGSQGDIGQEGQQGYQGYQGYQGRQGRQGKIGRAHV